MIIKQLLELNVHVSIINMAVGYETRICSFMRHLCRTVLNLDGCG